MPTITHGVTIHTQLVLQPDEKLEYRCKTGYYNNQRENVFCITDGRFTADIPVCKRKF